MCEINFRTGRKRSLVVIDKCKELAHHLRAILADAIVLVLIRHPRAQIAQVRGGGQGFFQGNEDIVEVDGGGGGGGIGKRA